MRWKHPATVLNWLLAGAPRFAGWYDTSTTGLRQSSVAFLSVGSQGLAPIQVVESPAGTADDCFTGCAENDPHPILADGRSFVIFGKSMWEVLTAGGGSAQPISLQAP